MAAGKDLEIEDVGKRSGIRLVLVVGFGAVIVLCFILVAVLLEWPSNNIKELIWSKMPFNDTLEDLFFPKRQTETLKPLHLIPRRDWLAQSPEHSLAPLEHPVHYVIISDTNTQSCQILPVCILVVRSIQRLQIEEKGWYDIAYNFLIGGDGNVYEGRGWDSEGAHTFGYNNRSLGISLVGNFSYKVPPVEQLLLAKQLIEEGIKMGKVAKDYKLLRHRRVYQ